ncbi:MAG: hypothetical protein U9Q77_01805 [Candidatus Marinimicrobia bacterium]|nr:hypothetical protein [Candidatus Neomarinimicrobiota bacterium]
MKLKNRICFRRLLIIILLGGLLLSCATESNILTLELEIQELICLDGQHIFEGRILSLTGIKAVTVNIQTQKAQIKYRENHVTAEEIKTYLMDYGFTIDGIKGNIAARKRLPSCCHHEG